MTIECLPFFAKHPLLRIASYGLPEKPSLHIQQVNLRKISANLKKKANFGVFTLFHSMVILSVVLWGVSEFESDLGYSTKNWGVANARDLWRISLSEKKKFFSVVDIELLSSGDTEKF